MLTKTKCLRKNQDSRPARLPIAEIKMALHQKAVGLIADNFRVHGDRVKSKIRSSRRKEFEELKS
jgi:hypothetical protein